MLRRVTTSALLPGFARRWCVGVVVPSLSESISEGTVIDVTVAVGDSVEEDGYICKIESEKATVDITAPVSGKLTAVPSNGQVAKVGEEIARVKEGAVEKKADAPKAEPKADAPKKEAPKQEAPKQESKAVTNALSGAPPPAQKTIVAGADTRVRKERISAMRRRIAERLKASQNTAAMLTTFNEIDMTPLLQLREKHKEQFLKKHGVKLGFMSPMAKACAAALQEVPIVNASWAEDQIEYHDFVDISIAVATKTGLVVPVLRDVQDMNFADIEKKIEDFGTRAKANKLALEEMTGGTFTISNGGTFGSWMGTPIINPPQSAIFGMHAIKKKPWVDEKGNIVVRDVMAVALTYDHRLIDGRDAVTFLVKVKNLIEDPVRLVLDLA